MITKLKPNMIVFALVLTISASCKQFKKPKACIEGPAKVELGQTASFTWCGDKADEIHWDGDYGISGEGESFSVTFNNPGQHTIYVRGNNKRSKETSASHYVTCIKPSYVWFGLQNICLSGGSTILNSPDLVNYKAYLYTTKTDWVDDVNNGNHKKCVDSVTCSFHTDYNNVGAYFKKTFATGTVLFVSVEYRNPQDPDNLLSNWADLINSGSATGWVNITNREGQDNTGSTQLSNVSRKILTGKWNLTKVITNGNPSAPSICNQDDYIKFYADGTWKYHVGSDNCNGSAVESSGTFGNYSQCIASVGSITMSSKTGPFTGFTFGNFGDFHNTLSVQVHAGSATVTFEFTKSL